jgi:predicted dithiol-disulfide oxidoreductase (DUF899 family)
MITQHPVVSRDEWIVARKQHLVKERELTHLRDHLSAERRELPWVKVDKNYVFDTSEGTATLADLFDGRSQLLVYHFMLSPTSDYICEGCSFVSDHIDSARMHFEHNDLSFVAISRAQIAQIESVKRRMDWRFRWVSSYRNNFNYDYHVSFTKEQIANGKTDYNYGTTDYASEDLHGISVFYKNEAGEIFHTYSSYARGGDILLGTYNFLDLTPKGRNETSTMDWVRLHDEYDSVAEAEPCCHS